MNLELYNQVSRVAATCGDKLLGIIPPWYDGLQNSSCSLEDVDFSQSEVLWKIGFNIIEILLRVGGLVAIGFIIYGGFMFATSQGDPEGAKKARNTITNALIGVVISLLASTIVMFVSSKF